MASRGMKSERPARSQREQKRREARTASKVEAVFQNQLRKASESSHGRRFQRAEVKLDEAKRIEARWLRTGWEIQETIEGDNRVFSVLQLRPLDEEFEHLVYEIAEGLLAALDHLAFSISEKNVSNWTQTQQDKSALPIRDKEPADRNSRNQYDRQVECWPEGALRELKKLQPYNYSPSPELSPLWRLRDLANRGKHRIIVGASANMNMGFAVNNGRLKNVHVSGVGEMTEHPQQFLRLALSSYGDINVQPDVQIRFGTGSLLEGHSVVDSLGQMHDYVKNTVLKALLPFA